MFGSQAVRSKKLDSFEQPNTRTSQARQLGGLKQSPRTMEALPRPLMAMVTVMLMPL
ncbi:GM23734 [Drosophila sechellia]|uniref:GM23734 n=1 Tax=Drosophila sechellia TaxID=7238 RepID=B4HLJ9_DROSE|nr:GM23734 [Drosophila sechellia]